jgi:microcystin-dependent protein
MSEPFLGELRQVSFSFAPRGWALCNGQLLAINQNQALFSLLGTTYGGNGTTSFALPDLRGRHPLHAGTGYVLGQRAGSESVTLTGAQVPPEALVADVPATTNRAATAAALARGGQYTGGSGTPVGSVGGSQPHPNLPPFLTMNWIIALQGIFPSRP